MAEEVWFHIAFAPRDGSRVRVRSDTGCVVHEAHFVAPYWWVNDTYPNGAVLTDDVIYGTPNVFDSAVQFQVLP